MVSRARQFVNEQRQVISERARKLGKVPAEIARSAAIKSAGRIKSLKDPVRALSHSGVKLTAISQNTAQSLIELQAQIVTSVLSNAADQLERAAQTEDVMSLARGQADVLRATRERIVEDLNQAVAIFKDAGENVRDVATGAYSTLSGRARAKAAPAAKKAARKVARKPRKAAARARKKAKG